MSRSEFPADTFVAAAGSTLHLLKQQPQGGCGEAGGAPPRPQFGQVLVRHGCPIGAARWNRNNRVVASGGADGQIQLLYSSGQVMSVLPRDAARLSAPLGPITSLSWSAGSKRLAAGSSNGTVYLYQMLQGGPNAPVELRGHLGGVTAVEFQHEDKFLAVASGAGSVVLYSDPLRSGPAVPAPLAASSTDTSARLCLTLAAASDGAVAAGTAHGSVAVWDAATQRLREEYSGQHSGAVNALSFVPLKPVLMYTAGADGRVCLQDRRTGDGCIASFSVGAPATSLMVKEDSMVLGVGTAEGTVLLYDPRHQRQPLYSMRCAEPGRAVTALHWQHRYPSLASRHRSAAAAVQGTTRAESEQPASAPTSSRQAMPPASSRVPAAMVPLAAAPAPGGSSPAGAAASFGFHIPAGPAVAAASAFNAASAAPPYSVAGAASVFSSSGPQVTPLHRSAAPTPAAIDVTPLPGMASRYATSAAAAAAEVTPLPPQQQQQWQNAEEQQQHPEAAEESPLHQPAAAAPAELKVTPLQALPAARQPAASRARARVLPALDISQQAEANSRSQLCVTPLPGMAPTAASDASPRHQRGVLGQRNASTWGSAVPQLALPQRVAPPEEQQQPQLHDSSSFAENEPLPACSQQQQHGGGGGSQQQWDGGLAAKTKAAAASAEAAGPAAQAGARGSGDWSIAAPPATNKGLAAGAAGPAAAAANPGFATAQQSQRALGEATAGFMAACAGVQAEAGQPGGGLRDDVLALHFDMLHQFQAQQACMGELVSQVLQQNQALSGEVAALRKQLAALSSHSDRRNKFLWL